MIMLLVTKPKHIMKYKTRKKRTNHIKLSDHQQQSTVLPT